MKILCSVVMASFQRRHLLERSLTCYERQNFDNDRLEVVVVDDHSKDNTREMVLDWSSRTKIKATVLTTSPKPGEWVDCGWCLNAGLRATTGEHLLITHPEVMPGRRSVAACVEKLTEFEKFLRGGYPVFEWPKWGYPMPAMEPEERKSLTIPWSGAYACCKPYYLSPRDQKRIDTVDWLNEGPLAVRKIEGFYDDQPGHPDYKPRAIESVGTGGPHTHWLSWVFGGCSRRTWREIGGMAETSTWGAVDVLWMQRRKLLGIVNHTCTADDTLVVHQNHDSPESNTLTPRIEQVWKDELAKIPTHDRQAMTVDYLGWRS